MKCTEYAAAYTARQRASVRTCTWADVARAYDEGLRHALSLSPSQQRHTIRLMRVLAAANREVEKS